MYKYVHKYIKKYEGSHTYKLYVFRHGICNGACVCSLAEESDDANGNAKSKSHIDINNKPLKSVKRTTTTTGGSRKRKVHDSDDDETCLDVIR